MSTESPEIRGEYWITDGDVWFADGDIGDMNHEMYALDYARRMILDFFNADSDHEIIDGEIFRDSLIEAFAEDGIALDANWEATVEEKIKTIAPERPELIPIFRAACERSEKAGHTFDVRDVAVKYFGWIWVRRNNFHTWTYDRRQMLDGLNEILEQEGDTDTDWSQLEINIFVVSTGKRLWVTLADLESGRTPGEDPWAKGSHGPVQEASGVFKKTLDNGREVFTCKCPVCGTLHGGYRSYAVAANHLKCRMCYRNEMDKLKKDIEKVDEPKKQKDIFQGPATKPDHPAVFQEAHESERFKINVNETEQEDRDVDAIVFGPAADAGLVNKVVCEGAILGQRFWHRLKKHADGAPVHVEVSGQCSTAESRPDEFKLPVRYGCFQSLYITEHNASEFTTVEPPD